MTWKKRSELKPGDIFAAPIGWDFDSPRRAYVVIDDKTEVEFFTGNLAIYGDVMPSYRFEVLACKSL